MRKVLLTVHKFFPEHRAGTEVLTLKVSQELIRRGMEVLVVTANPPDVDARRKDEAGDQSRDYVFDGVPVHVINESLRLKNYNFACEYNHPEIGDHFQEIIERFKPDLVHIFHAQNLSASIIDVAEANNLPVVASTTDFWFVCPLVQLKRSNGDVCRGPNSKGANCLTCYTPKLFPPLSEFQSAFANKYQGIHKLMANIFGAGKKHFDKLLYGIYMSSKLKPAIKATYERQSFLQKRANKLKAIMVPTKLMKDIFQENGIDGSLIHHVPFGIDTKPLIPYRKKNPSQSVRLGYIGTIFEHKGVDLLVKAFHSLPADVNANLTIYGDVNQFPDYGRTIVDLVKNGRNRAKINLAGTFPNQELGSVLANIDILVVPSRWYENTPLVIQSALATKTPLIATDLGGMSELIKHGVNGLLFELNNADSLAEQFQSVTNNPTLLEKFAGNIAEERTVQQMVDDIEAIYARVLAKPTNPEVKYAIVTDS